MEIFFGVMLGILAIGIILGTGTIFLLALKNYIETKERYLSPDPKQIAKQRAVIKGQLEEKYFPITAGHPLSEFRFIGDPIDYILFRGYTAAKDEGGKIDEVVFIEIKTNTSRLSPHQRKIKEAIEDRRVRWETITIKEEEYDRKTLSSE